MPFPYHVGAVASLPEPLRECWYVGGQAERLPCTDDRVLEPSVNLIPEEIDGGGDCDGGTLSIQGFLKFALQSLAKTMIKVAYL